MAQDYNILMHRFNGIDYDDLYPAPAEHSSTHSSGGSDAITPEDIGAEKERLQFTDTAVATTAFASDNTYEDYPYRAAIALTGVTAGMTPEVVFNVADVMSGNYASVCAAYTGGVYIYAADVPDAALTIPTITCMRGAS